MLGTFRGVSVKKKTPCMFDFYDSLIHFNWFFFAITCLLLLRGRRARRRKYEGEALVEVHFQRETTHQVRQSTHLLLNFGPKCHSMTNIRAETAWSLVTVCISGLSVEDALYPAGILDTHGHTNTSTQMLDLWKQTHRQTDRQTE